MVITGIVLFLLGNYPYTLFIILVAWLINTIREFTIKKYNEGLYLAEMQEKEGMSGASLEDAYNIDLDREWVGATAARAETIILSGVFQERK